MNTSALSDTVKASATWQTTGIVKGVKIHGTVPQVGHAAYHGINGDSYGYIIVEVAPDGTWFTYARAEGAQPAGKAWLCTRKNSRLVGCYVMQDYCYLGVTPDTKPDMNYRYARYSTIYASSKLGCGETELDPSF